MELNGQMEQDIRDNSKIMKSKEKEHTIIQMVWSTLARCTIMQCMAKECLNGLMVESTLGNM